MESSVLIRDGGKHIRSLAHGLAHERKSPAHQHVLGVRVQKLVLRLAAVSSLRPPKGGRAVGGAAAVAAPSTL